MNNLIHRYATPLTTGLFIISAVSGVALFFHWAPRTFHEMHEWLSMAWLAPFAFHVWKNWNALMNYLKRGTLLIPVFVCILVAVPFAWSAMSGGQRSAPPGVAAIGLMTQARLADLAPVFKSTPEALLAGLKQKGFEVQSADQTLDAVARASGKSTNETLSAVLAAGR